MQIVCPDCMMKIDITNNIKNGEIVDCENCGAEIKIIDINSSNYELIEDEK